VTLQEFLNRCSEWEKTNNPVAGLAACDQLLQQGAEGRLLIAALRYKAAFLLRAKQGDVAEVIGHLKEALDAAEAFPMDRPPVLMALVGAYTMSGCHRNAREFAEQYFCATVGSADPELCRWAPRIWFNLGYCYDSCSKIAEAIHCYSQARELGLQNPEWLNPGLPAHNLVQMYLELGKTADALAMLQEAQDQLDEAVWGAYWKDQQAQCLLALGRYAEAEAACREALAHSACDDTVTTEAHLTLARICLAQGQVDDATTYASTAYDLSVHLSDMRLFNKIEEFQSVLLTRGEVPES
jgi:tetratricopeptide (TPR) repeat protein